MWTKENLQQLIKEQMSDYLFIVVSNRQPYVHVFKKGKIECQRGAGGVITALDPVMQACDGIWIAYGNGDADRKVTDSQGRIRVSPENPKYTLKRVWLTKEEENGYYYGYSNEALWPLCHAVFQRPIFRKEDWEYYVKVNQKFAEAVFEEIGSRRAFVFIQDYHLTLLPKFLKEMAGSGVIIAHFWHIPWPNYEAFRVCPQRHQILEGLLSNDLLGFHIRYHCDNFLDVVDREIESKINRDKFSVIRQGHETLIRPYPISVDFESTDEISNSDKVREAMENLKQEYSLAGFKVLLGLDRLDYTKGIPERLLAIDFLLERHPELKEKIVFIQMGELSRLHIPRYKALNDEINALVEQINWRHSTDSWKPIILVRRHLSFYELIAFYRLGEVCIVSSLHDGMNLVAKEFLSSRSDERGMLVLSQFTGAARELTDAVLVNPYDREQFSEGIFQALHFSEEETKKRISKMRSIVQQNNIFRWAGKILSELLKFEFKE
ncbi:MAG: trehalose-6-phosphate synthase [Candidatus Omnitrophica bacterium CG23_combo_of_CG06-09_8_20_14_all_40_11]|nr:MAG: trehalose-6-phosphate synthase [Candidatus Omnitrophica bacterium CG23_combo_of_CG06-09_8_20_14_all_40_11]